MKILMVSSELAPYVKVGGLGDMVGSLSRALVEKGHDVRVLCPLYGSVDRSSWDSPKLQNIDVHLGFGSVKANCWEIKDGKRIFYFLENKELYDRHEVYTGPWGAHEDNDLRFSFLSRAAVDLCTSLSWTPDVIHCHDWPTGFIPIYLNTKDRHGPLGGIGTVLTIHNLQHQGLFDRRVLAYAGLPESVFCADGVECLGAVNMLKGGLYHATKLTTVSPSYAQEIQTPEGGCGLQHLLKFRAADLIGVLNGIDMEVWNPETDPYLPQNFSARNLKGKSDCKKALQKRFGLSSTSRCPVFGVVSRLYDQKGLDLFAKIIPRVMEEMDVQIVVLGSGEPSLERHFNQLADRYSDRMGVYIGYDEALSHLVEAGSDFFVMPSRFEPCGLNQMYSMRYGALPIVRATGGLLDTVEQYVEGKGRGSGFLFEQATEDGLYYTIGWACSTFYDRSEEYKQLQQNAMAKDFSWLGSAERYEEVYHWASENRKAGL